MLSQNDSFIEELKSKSPPPLKSSRIKAIQTKVQELYKKKFNNHTPDEISHLDLRAVRDIASNTHYLHNTHRPKDTVLEKLQKNHINLRNNKQIFDLPKLPWGSHKSYNNQNNFIEKHFTADGEYTTEKMQKFNKNLRLFSKITKKTTSKKAKQYNDYAKTNHVYATKSGILVCKKDVQAETSYEQVNERYRKRREVDKQSEKFLEAALRTLKFKTKQMNNSNDVVSRLYTPTPKTIQPDKISEKYKELFETEIL